MTELLRLQKAAVKRWNQLYTCQTAAEEAVEVPESCSKRARELGWLWTQLRSQQRSSSGFHSFLIVPQKYRRSWVPVNPAEKPAEVVDKAVELVKRATEAATNCSETCRRSWKDRRLTHKSQSLLVQLKRLVRACNACRACQSVPEGRIYSWKD